MGSIIQGLRREGKTPAKRYADGISYPKETETDMAIPATTQLTMYTTPWCGFCRRLKSQLAREGIDIAEVDIEKDPAAADYVMAVNGGNQTVPTVVLDTPDGQVALTNPSVADVKAQLTGQG